MVVFSKLYPFFSRPLKTNFYQIRHSGHGRIFEMYPSNFSFKKTMDFIHFYLCIVGVPAILFISYCNIFIGPSELIDIPEGYQPKEYEYNKRPISRMLARIMSDPTEVYAKKLDFLIQESERIVIRKISNHIMNIMEMKQDYDAYYFSPHSAHYIRNVRKKLIDINQEQGPLNALLQKDDF